MTDAKVVAEYIISTLAVDNLKLQKLLYYSQAVHMVLNNKKKLFENTIEAWQYGPVVPDVYHEYKSHGFETIVSDLDINLLEIPNKDRDSIDTVLEYYGVMSGMELVNKTHHEDPWLDVFVPNKQHIVIEIESIYKYFKKVLSFGENS